MRQKKDLKAFLSKTVKDLFEEITLKNCILIFVGCTVLAVGMYNIHSISGVTEGGTLGLALLLENLFGISPSVSSFVLNVICYAIGIKTLGKVFLVYSGLASAAFSAIYAVAELFPRIYPEIADMPLAASISGAVFVGVGVGLCVRGGGAVSGDDALAMSLSKLTKLKMQWIYLVSDITVLLLSLTYIPFSKIVYSLLTVVISGQIIGFVSKVGTNDK